MRCSTKNISEYIQSTNNVIWPGEDLCGLPVWSAFCAEMFVKSQFGHLKEDVI